MSKINHVVLLKFKEGTTEETVTQIFDQVLELSENVPGIENYTGGPNNSPEGLAQGFTHAFVITFSDAAARDAYLTNADHGKFKDAALPHVENVAIVDFEV
ncbi:MAG: Dabb family protein [Verrucomicrobia bacterium]|nr:Dabb family protein [Verrucomicrobiota bacterium]